MTKQETIKEHRKMWKWIADKCKKGEEKRICKLKREYLREQGHGALLNDCFCCQYAGFDGEDVLCERCPILWGTEETVDGYFCEGDDHCEGLYEKAKNILFMTSKEAEMICLKIAELPEKEERK